MYSFQLRHNIQIETKIDSFFGKIKLSHSTVYISEKYENLMEILRSSTEEISVFIGKLTAGKFASDNSSIRPQQLIPSNYIR